MVTSRKPKREYVYQAPINEEKLRQQLIYHAYRSREEWKNQPWVPGNLFDVWLRDENLGEAQVILEEARWIKDLTAQDALLTGFQNEKELRQAVTTWLGLGDTQKEVVFRVLYRWL